MRTTFRYTVPILVALLAISILWPRDAVAAPPTVDGASNVHGPRDEDEVRAYWTAERMRNAIPRDYVINDRGVVERGIPAVASKRPSTPTPTPTGTPEPSATTVKGALYPNNTDPVAWAIGKAYFTMGSTNYVCSGTVVSEGVANRVVVLTAGHCVYDETKDGDAGFGTNWMFIRNYDLGDAFFSANGGCATAPERCWVANALVVPQNWVDGSSNAVNWESDFAFAVFTDSAEEDAFDVQPYSYPVADATAPDSVYAFGYPAAGKYDGTQLAYCAGSTISDPYQGATSFTNWGLACDMTGGSSGGGWTKTYPDAPKLVGLNSYGYRGGPYKGYMFGPLFTADTQGLFSTALTASGNTRW